MGICVRQRDMTDCGAACIASVASYYKLDLPVARIRQMASTDERGTNILGLLEALQKLGFQAKGVRGEFNSLSKIPKPAIAHITLKEGHSHYVVIYKVNKRRVEFMDPAIGKIQQNTLDEFKGMWTGVLVILLPGATFEPRDERASVLARFWTLMQPHRSILLQALFGGLIYTLIGLSTSIYVQKVVDYVLVDGNRNLLNLMSVGMIILLLLQVFIGSMKSILTLRTAQSMDVQLILEYYKHLLKLPQQFFDSMRVGEIISRVNDAVKIRHFINDAATSISVNFFILVFSIALMFTFYWKLAFVIVMVVPFYAIIYVVTNLLNKKVERKLMENAAELETHLVESLKSIGTIKSFGLQNFTNSKMETRFIALLKSVYKSGLNSIFSTSSSEFIARLFTILLLWIGAHFALGNDITPGELLSFYALVGYFTGPVGGLISMNKTIQNAMIAADRLFEIMDLEREKDENTMSFGHSMIGDIRFTDVTFRYGTHANVCENLTLEIPKGKVTAIIGNSGSGKSTLMAILQKLYTVQKGRVYIGEYDLNYIRADSLRKLVGVVPQKIDLFAGNVIENIAIGDASPDMRKIFGICSQLGILEFIEQLPKGFNTYLGENGAILSGGQRQRIAIARALYIEPSILILDEATSSLDSSSEEHVKKAIQILREQDKTVIIIAHRLSTVSYADKIVVLDKGNLAEEGNHAELMMMQTRYARLWRQQFQV